MQLIWADSRLLEGVMIGDEDMIKKAIEDGEHIDDCNINGW